MVNLVRTRNFFDSASGFNNLGFRKLRFVAIAHIPSKIISNNPDSVYEKKLSCVGAGDPSCKWGTLSPCCLTDQAETFRPSRSWVRLSVQPSLLCVHDPLRLHSTGLGTSCICPSSSIRVLRESQQIKWYSFCSFKNLTSL